MRINSAFGYLLQLQRSQAVLVSLSSGSGGTIRPQWWLSPGRGKQLSVQFKLFKTTPSDLSFQFFFLTLPNLIAFALIRYWSNILTDAGKAVSMTTEQETIVWGTSHPLWWRSSASAQVCECVWEDTSVCAFESERWAGLIFSFLKVLTKSKISHIACLHLRRRNTYWLHHQRTWIGIIC